MGSHLGKPQPTGTSFLPTATAWDLSPPPPPPVLPGLSRPQGGACSGEDEEKANLYVTLGIPLPVHLPFLLLARVPDIPLPRVTIHLPPLSLPHPRRSCDRNPKIWAKFDFVLVCGQIVFPNLVLYQNRVALVKSMASLYPRSTEILEMESSLLS